LNVSTSAPNRVSAEVTTPNRKQRSPIDEAFANLATKLDDPVGVDALEDVLERTVISP
jgi:hypothetical protein